jgi:DNA modification methylase
MNEGGANDNLVRLGDGIAALHGLSEHSTALILSDLPSGQTRAAFDVVPDLPALWEGIWHALTHNGTVVLMASCLRFASEVIRSQAKYFRYDLIWSKSVATGFLNAAHAPLRAHEFILIFSKRAGTYHPQMEQGASPIHAARRKSQGENYGECRSTRSRAGATDRYPVSVLEFASVGTSAKERVHPQQKPVPLLRWLIRTYSDPGDWVVDPFAGSGSTGVAALAENRHFMGWDLSPRFGNR